MIRLSLFLLSVFLFFTLICLLFCIEAHFRYQNKVGIDQDKGFASRYEYFGQPIYDHQKVVIGYELLLREFDSAKKKWRLPKNVDNFPLSRIVYTINKIDPQIINSIRSLALNMTVSQLLDFRSNYFFKWALSTIHHKQLVVEIDASDIRHSNFIKRYRLLHLLKTVDQQNIKVTIENVDSSRRTYRLLRPFLPYIDYLKFNIHAFNKSANHWIDITLAQWQRRARANHILPIVGKIEDQDQVTLIDQLGIDLRQGYAYGQPELLNRSGK